MQLRPKILQEDIFTEDFYKDSGDWYGEDSFGIGIAKKTRDT